MKKTDIREAADTILLFPTPENKNLSRYAFETRAHAFLNKRISAEKFLEICDFALESSDNTDFERMVRKYRFLAFINSGNLIEAIDDAAIILKRFNDELLHYQMMCTIYLERKNCFKAISYLDKIIEFTQKNGLDSSAFEQERQVLDFHVKNIKEYTVPAFCLEYFKGECLEKLQCTHTPVLITGTPYVGINPAGEITYLIYNTGHSRIKQIFCHMSSCETPFIQKLESNQTVTVQATLLGADKTKLLMKPCQMINPDGLNF